MTEKSDLILDCLVGPIADPMRSSGESSRGVDTELVLGTEDTILVAEGARVREVDRKV